ncbi:MAG TPA: hypothetical protein VG389_27040 [Myxococcota bacterium]|nr:hypothetical protein [Myxococcota bacterium]
MNGVASTVLERGGAGSRAARRREARRAGAGAGAGATAVAAAAAAWLAAGGAGGCGAPFPKDDPEAVLEEGRLYVADASFRRHVLETSLVGDDNDWARARLASWALPDGTGWDALPEMTTPTEPVRLADVNRLAAGEPLEMDGTATPLFDGAYPDSWWDLSALGLRAFYEFPVRIEPVLEWILADPARVADYGLAVAADGVVVGVRKYPAPDGSVRVVEACALCHGSVDADGRLLHGLPNTRLDLGRAWADWIDEVSDAPDAEGEARLRSWGPGRVDVTPGADDDPLQVPPLTGLRDTPFLHQTGTVRHDQASALAMRIETLMITSWVGAFRPPRTVAFAAAAWIYDLDPPIEPDAAALAGRMHGARVFRTAGCSDCHEPRVAYSAPWLVGADVVGTDPASALTPSRGTGGYRVTPLRGVWAYAPYLHDGTVATLEDLFDARRVEAGWTRGVRGPGPVPGHRYGLGLTPAERADLLAFLRSL